VTTYFGSSSHISSTLVAAGYEYVNKHIAPASGEIETARLWGGGHTAGPADVRFVIFADNAGAPGALLGFSDTVNIPTSQASAERTFTFASPVPVVEGTPYWIGHHASAGFTLGAGDGGATPYHYSSDAFGDGPSDPFGSSGSANGNPYSYEAGITVSDSGGGGSAGGGPLAVPACF